MKSFKNKDLQKFYFYLDQDLDDVKQNVPVCDNQIQQ